MKRPILAGIALATALGACSNYKGPNIAYTTPGWYLELPHLVLVSGPEIFAGPMTYEECEAKRVQYERSERLLCIDEKMKPGPYGPYNSKAPPQPQPQPL